MEIAARKLMLFLLLMSAEHAMFAQTTVGYWKGYISYKEKKWEIAVHIIKRADTLAATIDFLDILTYEVPFSIKQKNNSVYLHRPQPGGKAIILDGSISHEKMQGWFSGVGAAKAPFTLVKTKLPPYIKEELVVIHDTVSLSGTLITPSSKGRFPLVIFVHGGSPDLRRVYQGPALEFVRNGFAALIYDKRGVGKSKGGHWQLDGIDALASDVIAWVQQLRNNEKIDSHHITVYGHSEGGWTTPRAASLCPSIKNIIVSGASAVSASRQTMYTKETILRKEGFSDSVVNLAMDLWQQLYAATVVCNSDTTTAIRMNKLISQKINTLRDAPWFASAALPYIYDTSCPPQGFWHLLFDDPLATWQKIKIPVLAVWGREDIVVPVDKSIELLKQTFSKTGNKKFKYRIFPGLDHSGNSIPVDNTWDFPRTSKDFFIAMIEWLKLQK